MNQENSCVFSEMESSMNSNTCFIFRFFELLYLLVSYRNFMIIVIIGILPVSIAEDRTFW